MDSSTKPTIFHLQSYDDIEQVKNLIVDKFKSKAHKTIQLVAYDHQIDQAVQLAIMIKNELQHGLHQTTQVQLVQGSQTLNKQIFSQNFG